MGSFSWLKADDLTGVKNIVYGMPFKFLIPKQFGGGYIKEKYRGYGMLGMKDDGWEKYNMYELLAFWNYEKVKEKGYKLLYDGEFPKLKETDKYTDHNLSIGIEIGCRNEQIDTLKYPLKLVSASFKGTYEDLDRPSYGDPDQGLYRVYR